MGKETRRSGEHELSVLEARPKLKRPPLYKVVLHNDDYTPMEFVVLLLEQFFAMPREKATQVMAERESDTGYVARSHQGEGCLRGFHQGYCGNKSRAGQ